MDSLIEGLQGFDYDADNWSIGINDTAVPYIDTQQDGQPQRKRRKLNMDKCERCRKDKKKCEPQPRDEQTKCNRCQLLGHECSPNTRIKKILSTDAARQAVPLLQDSPFSYIPSFSFSFSFGFSFPPGWKSGVPQKWTLSQLHDAVGVVQLLEERRAVYQEVKAQFEQLFGDGNGGDMDILSEAMRENALDDEDDEDSSEDDEDDSEDDEDDAEKSFYKVDSKMTKLKIQLLFLINHGLKQAGSAAVSDFKYAQRQLLFPSRPIFHTSMASAKLMESLCTAEDFPGAYTALQSLADKIPIETYTRKHHSIFASLYLRIAQLPLSLGVDIPKCVPKSPVLFRRGVWFDVAERGLLNCRRDLLPEYPATDCTGSTVLHNLAGARPSITTGLFLSMNVPKGTPPNQQDFFGRTALLIAIENRNHDMIKYLLANGADITLKTNYHHTPLHYAAAVGCKQTCEMLVEAGARADAEDIAGRQPMFYSSAGGHGSAVDVLLTQVPYNAGMNILCYEESCPVRGALWNGHESVALAISSRLLNLKRLTLKQSSMLWEAATFFRSWNLIRLAFDHIGDNVNTKNEVGESPLLAAVEEQNIEMVYLILSHPKVNAGLAHRAGRTALHMAVIHGNLEIVSAIAARADCALFAKVENFSYAWLSPEQIGKTAYELAIHYKHQEIASLLQDLMAKLGQ